MALYSTSLASQHLWLPNFGQANTPNVSPGGNPKVIRSIHHKENFDCFKRPLAQCAVSKLASDDTLKSSTCAGRAPDDSLTNATSTEPDDVLSNPPVQCADASDSSTSDATTPAARILTVKALSLQRRFSMVIGNEDSKISMVSSI
ncbi:hypothetical protein R3P38DRAFT_2792268 [Favolaschia claudopus]|uniref:Uncharacterized protein n=1 Tax=Favolaschia claudopus TaxID=2862362 RepID=A0AAW0AE29_9AGAR